MITKYYKNSTNSVTVESRSTKATMASRLLVSKFRGIEYFMLGILLLGFSLTGNTLAAANGANELSDISVASMPDERVQVTLTLAKEATKNPSALLLITRPELH